MRSPEKTSRRSGAGAPRVAASVFVFAALAGCGAAPRQEAPADARPPVAAAPRSGGYYLDDGPGANPPADLERIPDAVPKVEPIRSATSRPYVVMGRSYTPMTALQPYKARGIATWYGRRYHGKPTSSGEIYDMYAMTAAHATLPIPSYARVTNLANGKAVVVRINDRGPFFEGRIIDLSYTAAHRIGVLAGGSATVEVEAILPEAPATTVSAAAEARPVPIATPPTTAPATAAGGAEPTPAAELPVAAEAGGYFLQLGAFGSRDNAENFMSRIKAQSDWLAENLHIFVRDGLFRVHAGPYASQGEARQAALRAGQTLGARPMVLTR